MNANKAKESLLTQDKLKSILLYYRHTGRFIWLVDAARIWGGMEWTYNPLHAYKYLPLRDRAESALKDTEEFQ